MNPLDKIINKKHKVVIGLMSGTSMDGIDASVVEIKNCGLKTKIKPLGFVCRKYNAKLRKRLSEVDEKTTIKETSELNHLVAVEFAIAAKTCADKFVSGLSNVDLIGSHGQTVYHNPPSLRSGIASTVQIGDIDIIAEKTSVTTVGDFRQRDIAAGGEGAPIIPYIDYLLFHKCSAYPVIAQNIGGIANTTVITKDIYKTIAFDTGPGNMLMDGVIGLSTNGAKLFDRNGSMARKGMINQKLLNQLLSDDYYRTKPPKSTGAEKFGSKLITKLFKRLQRRELSLEDMLRTLLALTVETIAQSYESFILPGHDVKKVILSGGGAKNTFLVDQLKRRLSQLKIITSDEVGIAVDAKEAIGMAVLANELISGMKTNIPSCTGAKHNVPMGKVSFSF